MSDITIRVVEDFPEPQTSTLLVRLTYLVGDERRTLYGTRAAPIRPAE